VKRIDARSRRNPALPQKFRSDEFYLGAQREDVNPLQGREPQTALALIATPHLVQNAGRRHQLVSVPMVFPPRPGDRLLGGKFTVRGEAGDQVRRDRGFDVDAWHDWFPRRGCHSCQGVYMRTVHRQAFGRGFRGPRQPGTKVAPRFGRLPAMTLPREDLDSPWVREPGFELPRNPR